MKTSTSMIIVEIVIGSSRRHVKDEKIVEDHCLKVGIHARLQFLVLQIHRKKVQIQSRGEAAFPAHRAFRDMCSLLFGTSSFEKRKLNGNLQNLQTSLPRPCARVVNLKC